MKFGYFVILVYCLLLLIFYNVEITKSNNGEHLTIKVYDQIAKAYGGKQHIAIITIKSKNKIY